MVRKTEDHDHNHLNIEITREHIDKALAALQDAPREFIAWFYRVPVTELPDYLVQLMNSGTEIQQISFFILLRRLSPHEEK